MIYFRVYIISQLLLLQASGEQNNSSSLWEKLPKECGRTKYDKQKVRIIDGDVADIGQFPWLVRIGQTENDTINFYCGGSLINKYYVVTAAHCEDDGDIVRLGENYLKTDIDCDRHGDCAPPHQDIKVKQYRFLEFQHDTHLNDLGLIELEQPATFNEYVQPICLPRDPLPHKDLVSKMVNIAGWGVMNIKTYSSATKLMYVVIPISDEKECNAMYPHRLADSQLCIGFTEGGKDSCGGDSGGPASMSMKVDGERRHYLVALVSYGLTMCGKGVAVYTDVSYFVTWILENIDKS